ncbi:hypothetical protein JHD50_13195 [Sulfurimonas sp. MAG313]|nr:hypothetical protein [Sulfurimonas sp. MAG313]MDF1882244.1 hypothetical protein [Sulfurimonas sp. MAG313]
MYKNIIFIIIALIFFSGCLNKRGISSTYYNDCREYYDARGYYHKKCDENIVDYSDMAKGAGKAYDATIDVFSDKKEEPKPIRKVVW